MLKIYHFWALFNLLFTAIFTQIKSKIIFLLQSTVKCVLLVDQLTLQSLKDTNIFPILVLN